MLHVRVNRKLCYTSGAIDSSKIKVPGFWGEALMPSEKKIVWMFCTFYGNFNGKS